MMTDLVEHVTHMAAVVFYILAAGMGAMALHRSRLWARRVASIGVVAVAAGWLAFYLFVVEPGNASTVVLWSRIFHYNTATWLFIIGYVIDRSERYGVDVALSRHE